MLKVKLGEVVDRFIQVIPEAANRADQYVATIAHSIQEQQLPVQVTHQDASTGFMGSFRGKTREFLVVSPDNPALGAFTMLHFGVPSGVNLATGWYLTERGRGQKNIIQMVHQFGGAAVGLTDLFSGMDLFDVADMGAILAGVHQLAVMEAVYAIASEVGYDRDRIDSKSVGFFGIG